ncbi:hypothetical protein [Methylobacterium sp. ID0610]|uniref:hypothetical protein n=1 Tax=Methylobacterium carpenticola TaxID=3344827 RepID=UPI0036822D8A
MVDVVRIIGAAAILIGLSCVAPAVSNRGIQPYDAVDKPRDAAATAAACPRMPAVLPGAGRPRCE